MKRLLTVMFAGALLLSVSGPAGAGKPRDLFQDPAGDAGLGAGPAVGHYPLPAVDQAGFDLVSGGISRKGQNLEFRVTSAAMPQTGSLPEGAVFLWHFLVDGEQFRLMIKSQDVGKPRPTDLEGTDRVGRVDIEGHFRLQACEGPYPSVCEPVTYADGVFDPAAKSFSATIPMKDIGATTGSLIQTDALNERCPVCWVTHTAENDPLTFFNFDKAGPFADFRVPGK